MSFLTIRTFRTELEILKPISTENQIEERRKSIGVFPFCRPIDNQYAFMDDKMHISMLIGLAFVT